MNKNSSVNLNDSHEHKVVRHDMVFVLTLSVLLVAGIVALYFWDQATGFVSETLTGLIRF